MAYFRVAGRTVRGGVVVPEEDDPSIWVQCRSHDNLPLRLFGNEVIMSPDHEGQFGIIDRHGVTHWIDVNFG